MSSLAVGALAAVLGWHLVVHTLVLLSGKRGWTLARFFAADTLVAIAVVALHGVGLFSNSFIEAESQTTSFLLSSLLFAVAIVRRSTGALLAIGVARILPWATSDSAWIACASCAAATVLAFGGNTAGRHRHRWPVSVVRKK